MNIFAHNPETTELEKTYLSKSTATGETVFKVKNTNNFTEDSVVLVGEMGNERSEILTVASVTPTQLTLSAAEFYHDADDPVYLLDFDEVKIFRSTTGEDGIYASLATVPIDVDNADKKTRYDDENSLDSYYYEIAYYNSVTDTESEHSARIKADGYPEDTAGAVILDSVSHVKDRQFMIFSPEELLSIMNNVNDDLITQAKRPYDFLKTSQDIDVDADDNSIPYPDDLFKFDNNGVEVNTGLSSQLRGPKEVSPMDLRYRRTYTTLPSDDVTHIAYDDENDEILFMPDARTTRIGAFTLHYYANFRRFTSFSDKIQTPNGLVYKLAIWRDYYLQKADDDTKWLAKANNYEKRYNTEVMKLQRTKNIKANGPKGLGPQIKRYRQ